MTRNEAIFELIKYRRRLEEDSTIDVEPFDMAVEALEREKSRLPSAQLERKGEWIYGESEAGNDGYYCSKCGNFIPWVYKEFDIDFIKEFKFCPNCGSDMRERREDDKE